MYLKTTAFNYIDKNCNRKKGHNLHLMLNQAVKSILNKYLKKKRFCKIVAFIVDLALYKETTICKQENIFSHKF